MQRKRGSRVIFPLHWRKLRGLGRLLTAQSRRSSHVTGTDTFFLRLILAGYFPFHGARRPRFSWRKKLMRCRVAVPQWVPFSTDVNERNWQTQPTFLLPPSGSRDEKCHFPSYHAQKRSTERVMLIFLRICSFAADFSGSSSLVLEKKKPLDFTGLCTNFTVIISLVWASSNQFYWPRA